MEDFPLISVIIVNWNGKEYLSPCVRSVQEQSYPNLEVVLVDNGSTDGSVEYIRSLFPRLHWIVNRENLGYGGGNNRGIRAAAGEYLLILNNDTEMEPRCVERLWKGMNGDRGIGMTTPKILLYDRNDMIDAAGLTIYPDGLSIGRGHMEPEAKYSRREEVFCGSGCASLLRREMLEEIGLFDEDFFAYAEDTDLGWRARLAGWTAYYVPEAIVYHHHSKKFGIYSPFKTLLIERNRMWVAWKNFPASLLALWPAYTLWRYFYQAIGILMRKGAPGRFGERSSPLLLILIVLKSYFQGLKGLPLILKKRREVQSKKKISVQECYRLFNRFGIKAREIAFKE
jgi:GT2 family glycosyltransferase